jgi:hypothetical protein
MNKIDITDDEIWELIGITFDTLSFVERISGHSAFGLNKATREKLSLGICERNLDKLPLRLRSRLKFVDESSTNE